MPSVPFRCADRLRAAVAAAAALLCALQLATRVSAQDVGGWRTGRVTYFGAPPSFAAAYDPSRGNGSFGILEFGACGYTNADGSLAVPREQAAAAADASEDYPGSCGRCYDLHCAPGPVLDNAGRPIMIKGGFYEGDRFRPYLPAINPNVTDMQGRSWPGNPEEAEGRQRTVCNDERELLRIRITDSCPCTQVLKEGAPGVAAGGETRTQTWCCGAKGLTHFDVSYEAFERLTHPVSGVAMVQFRPVRCGDGSPLPFTPGFVDRGVIFSGGPAEGWSYNTYSASGFRLQVPEAPTPSGEASTCMRLSPGGGLQFRCRECHREGYRPFEGVKAVSFWLRGDADNGTDTAAPRGGKPPLKLILQKAEDKRFCGKEPNTDALEPAARGAGGWLRFDVPVAAFDCQGSGGLPLGDVTQLELQNSAPRDAPVCVGDVRLQR